MSETRVVHVNDNVEGAVYIGRANGRKRLPGSVLRNPFKIGPDGDRADVIAKYRKWVIDGLDYDPILIEALIRSRGKPLACWCRHDGEAKTVDNACHGDVLVDLLERYSDDELRAMGKPS